MDFPHHHDDDEHGCPVQGCPQSWEVILTGTGEKRLRPEVAKELDRYRGHGA